MNRKIAHFMYWDMKFTKPMSNKFIHMDECDNDVFIVSDKNYNEIDIVFNDKVKLVGIDYFYKMLKMAFNNYDEIIFHSVFFIKTKYKIKMIFSRKLFKKIVWIPFGADLYHWKTNSFIKNIVTKIFFKSFKYMAPIFPKDVDFYKEKFNKKIVSQYISYTSASENYPLSEYYDGNKLKEKFKNNETIFIQVGHSSTPLVNHIDVLKSLERFKEENIKIVLFLSYGDMDYAEKVSKTAIDIFGEKAMIIKDFLPKSEFFDLNKKIDIGIFNIDHQIALGNINPLIRKNKLVIIPSKCSIYKFYRENNVMIYSYEDFEKNSFEEIITSDLQYNKDFLVLFDDKKENSKRWLKVLNMANNVNR